MPLTIVICGGRNPKPILAVRDPGIVAQIAQLLMHRLSAEEDVDALEDETVIEEVIFDEEL